jgi:AmiR/NasT family two-component response regulator
VGTALARAISAPALRQAISLAGDEESHEDTPIEMRREVHQATGMMLAQLDLDATDALARMRAYAFSHGFSLREVARDVVNRRLNFSSVED